MTSTVITLTTSQRTCHIPEALMGSRAVTCSPYYVYNYIYKQQCGRCHDSVKHKIVEWVGMVHPSINSDCDATATKHILPEAASGLCILHECLATALNLS